MISTGPISPNIHFTVVTDFWLSNNNAANDAYNIVGSLHYPITGIREVPAQGCIVSYKIYCVAQLNVTVKIIVFNYYVVARFVIWMLSCKCACLNANATFEILEAISSRKLNLDFILDT